MSTEKPLLSRKDIAALLVTVSTRQVASNEKRWGLDKARADLNCRNVRYRAVMTFRILRSIGLL